MNSNKVFLRVCGPMFVALLFATGTACSKPERPSRAECVQGFRNFIRLMTKDNPRQAAFMKKTESVMVKNMAGKCMKSRKRPIVLCEIKADSLAALKACRNK